MIITRFIGQLLQGSSLRLPILKTLLHVDNTIRRSITFFALEKGMHPKHRIIDYHQFFLDQVHPEDHVLDIGCGNGFLSYELAQKVARVVGVDNDGNNITFARTRYHHPHLEYILGDATTFYFKETFNVIILSNVLEHIQNRIDLLKKIKYIAPKLLIRVPMIDRDWLPILKREMKVEYRLDPTHFIEYFETSFRQEMSEVGLTITSLEVRFGEIYSVVKSIPR